MMAAWWSALPKQFGKMRFCRGIGGVTGEIDTASGPIIVFDGECVLCSANAQFVLKYDRAGRFRLAAMQGEAGAALMARHGINPADPETFIVVDGDKVTRNSDAALMIAAGMGWPWKAAKVFWIIPRGLRDAIYGLVARKRYRIFGRRETCWMPDAKQAERVL